MKQWNGTTLLLLSSVTIHAHIQNNYIITNGITKDMTGYEFWQTKYYPDRLTISINGKPMEPGAKIEIPGTEKVMTVRYDYSFAKGFRTGAKEILFELCPTKKSYALSFSWYNQWRVALEGAQPKEMKRVRYKA